MEDRFDIELDNDEELDISIGDSVEIINIGTNNYNQLINKPRINDVELIGNKSLDNLGIQEKGNYANTRVTNLEIDSLFN